MRLNIPGLLIMAHLMLVTAWNYQSHATRFITPEVIFEHKACILLTLSMEAFCYAVSLLKFGRATFTHAWLCRLRGIILLMVFTVMFINYNGGTFYHIYVIAGLISLVYSIAITLIIPEWTCDVTGVQYARQIGKGKEIKRFKLLNG